MKSQRSRVLLSLCPFYVAYIAKLIPLLDCWRNIVLMLAQKFPMFKIPKISSDPKLDSYILIEKESLETEQP